MAKNNTKIRGILQGQELRNNNWRDSRTLGEKFSDNLEKPNTSLMILFIVTTVMFIYPALLEVAFIIGTFLFILIKGKKVYLPFRMPQSSGLIDYNTPTPSGFKKGTGIVYLGNELGTRKELWLNDSDARTHFLIFGSTGAGKALRSEELVLTKRGWVKNKDLIIGDFVMRPTGEWSEIVGIFPQGLKQLYSLTLEDGRNIEITSDHLWEIHQLKDIESGAVSNGEVTSTYDIQQRLLNNEKLAIKTVNEIDFENVQLDKEMDVIIYESVLASVKGTAFDLNVEKIISGSYSQREYFFTNYKNEMKKQYGFSLGHYSYEMLGFYDLSAAKTLQRLAHSLGLFAKLINKDEAEFNTYNLNEDLKYYVYIKNVDFIKINKIEETTKYEECQCIKISAADGLFVTKDYIVTHNTETLLSLAFNTLVQGSGFIYVDGKGDNTLFMKIFSMLRSLGREDDLLTLNYMTGSRDVSGPQEDKLSNTLNPLSTGTPNGLTELIVSLMGGGSGGGDGDMWKGRAIAMISAVMRALVWKRDNQGLLLDVTELRDALLLENIQKLARDSDLPPETISSLNAYLLSLPGYVASAETQESGVLEQHGFLQMQFTRILGSLSDDYGYIFKTQLGEIDFLDVVLNNRVLCVLLPALEKSIDELANLGKIVVACLKIMMSAGLGDRLEGETKLVIDTKSTFSLSPYMCILDEYGYYVVTGAAVMPAQARSLYFSMVFAGQDFPSFKKNNNSEEAAATIGNCNIKIFMKIEDPTDTYDLAKKSAGEDMTSRATQQEISTGIMGATYNDTQNIANSREPRLDWLDLKDQTEGQAHIVFKSILIRAAMFYANPKKPKYLRLNHFIKVSPPTRSEIEEYTKPVLNLSRKLKERDLIHSFTAGGEDVNIKLLGELIKEIGKSTSLSTNEKYAAVIAMNMKSNDDIMQSLLMESQKGVNEFSGKTNIYAEGDDDDDFVAEFYHKNNSISELLHLEEKDQNPLINEKNFVKSIDKIESFVTSPDSEESKEKHNQLRDDIAGLTTYPACDIPNENNEVEFIDTLNGLLKDIQRDL